MKRFLIGLAAIGLLWASSPVEAQVSPIRLKVSKRQKSDLKTTYQSSGGEYRSREGVRAVSYTIEVSLVSGTPRDVTVKWAVLVKRDWWSGSNENQWQVVDGERKATIEFAKKLVFDTDVIELQRSEHTSEGQYREYGSKVEGYAVEVSIGDQLVASDAQPPSVKAKIEQARGGTDQKRHRF
jgi:hypothetical protein